MNVMLECPKCKGRMEEGFMLDHTHGGFAVGRWIKGVPEKSFWTGIKTKGKEQRAVSTFRCESCNYLEFYAK